MKKLIISADDYGMSPSIDAGILDLIQKNRLTATSCLVRSPRWAEAAKKITPAICAKADIGLHLDFTEYEQTLNDTLPALIIGAHLRMLSKKQLRTAVNQQLDLFESVLGFAPHYVDGHQHVHQLPQIRDILIEELCFRYGRKMPWLRVARPPLKDGYKAFLIGAIGASSMHKQLKVLDIAHTNHLLGVYQFDLNLEAYAKQLEGWLSHESLAHKNVALMCHPAMLLANQEEKPAHFSSRWIEYQVLSDNYFKNLLEKYEITLVRGDALRTA
jgi:predicted glycoside hydrolase/deacetylase ChbG (UPF0249 family)